MIEVYEISGMTCQHCVVRVQKALASNPNVSKVEVTLNPPMATITSSHPMLTEELQAALSKVGAYSIAH